MDILFSVVISALAAAFALITLHSLTKRWLKPKYVRLLLTYPLSYVALWTLGLNAPEIFVAAGASSFCALVLVFWFSEPAEVTQVIRRR
jgi:hypothetical protein